MIFGGKKLLKNKADTCMIDTITTIFNVNSVTRDNYLLSFLTNYGDNVHIISVQQKTAFYLYDRNLTN